MQTPPDNATVSASGEQGILEAAEILFAEKGFDAVSMSAIAKLANTSKPNIYHHFKNKDELYLAIIKTAVQRASSLLDELEGAPGTFRQRLARFSAGQLDNIIAHGRSTQLVLREALSGNSERARETANYMVSEVFNRLVALVRHGQENGELREDIDPTLAAFMIESANMFYFQTMPIMKNIPEINYADDAGAFTEGVMDIIFNGVLQK
jgi:TetR/AcrR family transcriptional regulator